VNSPLVPSVIGNELKMRTLSFQNYTLLTVQSVRDIFTTIRYFRPDFACLCPRPGLVLVPPLDSRSTLPSVGLARNAPTTSDLCILNLPC
jgi:hypothetical protein